MTDVAYALRSLRALHALHASRAFTSFDGALHQASGHLVRTKLDGVDEGGVAAGSKHCEAESPWSGEPEPAGHVAVDRR